MSIELRNITVRFGGVTAVNSVSLDLEPGRILSVVGPNGSGKSTLFNAVSGLVPLAGGTVTIDGKPAADLDPSTRVSMGVARTFQTPRFDPRDDVTEAVLCGYYPRVRAGWIASTLGLPSARREEAHLRDACQKLLVELGLHTVRDKRLGELSMGQVRLADVARAVANEPKYLLLDEPAAGLSRDEQRTLVKEVRRLADRGIGVLLVEHNFGLIRELADHAVVLDRGTMCLSGRPHDIEKDRAFVELYLGSTGTLH
jgi:branched-chain amino acid transport system ATP-binding protein